MHFCRLASTILNTLLGYLCALIFSLNYFVCIYPNFVFVHYRYTLSCVHIYIFWVVCKHILSFLIILTWNVLIFGFKACADEFYTSFNSLPFNSIEEDLCHLVYVARVEIIRESEVMFLTVTFSLLWCVCLSVVLLHQRVEMVE